MLPSRRVSSYRVSSSTIAPSAIGRGINGIPEEGGQRRGREGGGGGRGNSGEASAGRGISEEFSTAVRSGGGVRSGSHNNGGHSNRVNSGDSGRPKTSLFSPIETPAVAQRRTLASQLARQRLKKAARYARAGLAVAPPFVAKVSAGKASLEAFLSSSGVDWER